MIFAYGVLQIWIRYNRFLIIKFHIMSRWKCLFKTLRNHTAVTAISADTDISLFARFLTKFLHNIFIRFYTVFNMKLAAVFWNNSCNFILTCHKEMAMFLFIFGYRIAYFHNINRLFIDFLLIVNILFPVDTKQTYSTVIYIDTEIFDNLFIRLDNFIVHISEQH